MKHLALHLLRAADRDPGQDSPNQRLGLLANKIAKTSLRQIRSLSTPVKEHPRKRGANQVLTRKTTTSAASADSDSQRQTPNPKIRQTPRLLPPTQLLPDKTRRTTMTPIRSTAILLR